MLDSSCANACALNGLPGPMRHWFTGFTHSLIHSHASRQYGRSLLMVQPCPRNVGIAGFFNGISEECLLTLGRERCKDIPSGKAVAIDCGGCCV